MRIVISSIVGASLLAAFALAHPQRAARLTVQKDEALQLLAQQAAQAAQAAQTAGRDDAAALHREIAEQRDVIERQRVAYNEDMDALVRELRAQQLGRAEQSGGGAVGGVVVVVRGRGDAAVVC